MRYQQDDGVGLTSGVPRIGYYVIVCDVVMEGSDQDGKCLGRQRGHPIDDVVLNCMHLQQHH